jgi:protein-disulfide isomerase
MIMRKLIPSIAAFAAAASLHAADPVAIKAYVTKALPRCAGSSITVEPIRQPGGPVGFEVFKVVQKSTDENCGAQKYLSYSPKTHQVFFGSVLSLPLDPRTATVRISETVGQILKAPVNVNISPFPLPDGVRAVAINRQTEHGQFAYSGYIDSSERHLLVGLRGNLNEDPAKTLRDAIGAQNAARRGNKTSKLEIIEISDFQCPTCARAHEALEPLLSKNLNKINYARLDLPLFEHHDWAVNAALGARAIQRVAPAKYWNYVDQVFKNQEKLGTIPFETFLKNFAGDNDIDWTSIQAIYGSRSERQAVLDQTSRSFAVGINSTPTFLINGQMIGFGDGTYVTEVIKKALAAKK